MTTRRATSANKGLTPLDDSLLVLFDGHALFHRAFHAIKTNLSVSKTGEPTGAVYGFTASLLKALGQYRPAYAAVAFDRSAPTLRHRAFAQYKAQRPPMPDPMRAQFGRIRQMTETLGLPIFELDDYEADDILGCLSVQATEQGLQTIIVTGDTDTMQLVSPTVRVLFQRGLQTEATFDLAAVRARYGLEPSQIPHLKALRGDPSDNIPGVPGVGEKTATPLLQKFGTVQGIYDHLDEVTPLKLRDLLRQYEAQARQGLDLATIVTTCPIKLERDRLRWTHGLDRARVVALFRELEFMSLLSRLPEVSPLTPPLGQAPLLLGLPSSGAKEGAAGQGADVLPPPLVGEGQGEGSVPETLPSPPAVRTHPDRVGTPSPAYRTITTLDDLSAFVSELAAAPAIALYLQPTVPDLMQAGIVGLALAWAPGQAAYLPLNHQLLDTPRLTAGVFPPSDAGAQGATPSGPPSPVGAIHASPSLPSPSAHPELVEGRAALHTPSLKDLLESDTLPKVLYVAREALSPLANAGIRLQGLAMDTSVAAHLLGRPSVALPNLVLGDLGIEMPTLPQILGARRVGAQRAAPRTFAQLPLDQAAQFACQAADYTLRLGQLYGPALQAPGGAPGLPSALAGKGPPIIKNVFTELEMPLTPVIVRMERNGILVDVERLHRMSGELHAQMAGMEAAIYDDVGHRFNINSPKQLGDILFEELHLPHGRRTQTGWSTDAAVLEGLRGQHPVVARILEYREVSKLVSTYLDALPQLVNPRTGRIHTTYNQTGSATGRISSNDPNLQNIPVRTELGKRIRTAFVAPVDGVLIAADYSQIDLRVLAHLSGDPALQEAFRNGEDIHAATAAAVLNIPRGAVTGEHRRIAKTVNFGIVYGMSGFGLAQRMEMDRKEADKFIAAYFARYAKVKEYMDRTIQQVRGQGYVQTLLGRRRYIPEVNAGQPMVRAAAERMAINMPVQGTSADIIKLAMLRMQERLDALRMNSQMLLQIHDELLFEAPMLEAGALASLIQEVMPNVLMLDVPLVVEVKIGRSWGELE